jgi:hypothetical protein
MDMRRRKKTIIILSTHFLSAYFLTGGLFMDTLRKECHCKIKLHVLKVINQLDLDDQHKRKCNR